MKAKSILFFAIVAIISIATFYFENRESVENPLLLSNIEALASPEVSMDFCMYTQDICTIYSDGYAIKGYLQYHY